MEMEDRKAEREERRDERLENHKLVRPLCL